MLTDLYKYWEIPRDEKEDQMELEKVDRFLFWGLAIILLIVPLISRIYIDKGYISPVLTGIEIIDTGAKGDVFTAYKYIFLVIFTILLSLLFIYKVMVLKYEIPKSRLFLFLSIFVLTIALSVIFAPYKTLALHGMYNRHDGTITYLCYLILFFIAANITYDLRMLKILLYSLCPFIFINALLGVLNFYNYDVLQLSWVKKLLYSSLPEGMSIDTGSRLQTTVNNGNYVSGISATLIGLFLTWALLDGNKIRKIFNILISLILFAMLLTSLSVSGFLTMVLIFPVILFFALRMKKRRELLLVFTSFLIGSSFIYTVMVNENPRVWDETFGFFHVKNPFVKEQQAIDSLEDHFSSLKIHHSFLTSFSNHVYAEELSKQKNEYKLPDLPAPGVGPGTGRLYIWEKTFELIKQRPFFGYGLDTLVYFFPQDDPKKQANLYDPNVVVDKPHNMYIGIAYGAGVIALISFLCMLISILLIFLRCLLKNAFLNDCTPIVVSLFISCLAYLIQALFNDSLIGVTVIFWILLGVFVSLLINNLSITDE